ncbi:glucans biosynthesis glucosyltransferase MdoH, partial [Aliiruegeria sabulilitoris]|uniref:glucans biosynthesis glucosyltransferase MdoH n=1 Tax=Aliiruegeria sabulilitoris TaxID=1510458 RepID=UPI000831C157
MRDVGLITARRRAPGSLRVACLGLAALCGLLATVALAQISARNGVSIWDIVRCAIFFVTTIWLAWGAVQAMLGLSGRDDRAPLPELAQPQPPTVLLLPICHEDPVAVFARVAAMDRSIRSAGLEIDIAVLSDSQTEAARDRERAIFAMLLAETGGTGRIFYRNRSDNRGRKAGNIESFIRRSGGAYDLAIVLDADSLMEGETMRGMIARMQAEPDLGLLQTLPRIIGARSLFGRAIQFSSAFHAPFFTRGLIRLQGGTGTYWGHNAIFRIRAFAACCGLPELPGKPPLGGTILSHDYVEAALLARGGWRVEIDERFGGSFEEGPENLLTYARRDRRWCQGNLQHTRLITAPGLRGWSRFQFLQGALTYLVSPLWALFLLVSVLATVTTPLPDYFPEPQGLFPVFPDDPTGGLIALALGICCLLLLPKIAIWAGVVRTGRVQSFGGAALSSLSVIAEVLLSSLLAPLMMAYQTHAVAKVLLGHDGGWPAGQRGEGSLGLAESWRASRGIALTGTALLAAGLHFSPTLIIWLLPVGLPLVAAPLVVAVTSRPVSTAVFLVSDDIRSSPVVSDFRATFRYWVLPCVDGSVGARDDL